MLLDDKKKKNRYYRQKQKKAKPFVPSSQPVTKTQPSMPHYTARNESANTAPQQPIVTQDQTPTANTVNTSNQPQQTNAAVSQPVQNTQPVSGMQSLVTQGYDPSYLTQMIVNSPTLQKIRDNDEKIARLRETPVQDKDGFWWSLAKAGMSGLAQAFNPTNPIRSEGDFYNRASYALGSAVGGGVNKKWNEVRQIQNEVAATMQENEILQERAKQEFEMQQKAAQFATQTQKAIDNTKSLEQRAADRKRQLDLNEGRFNFTKLRADQQNLLKAIQMKGFYREGIDPELDKQLAEAGVVMADFDTRPPIVKEQGGKYFQYDRDTNKWVESDGIPVDESEVPIEFSVDGQRLMLRPRDIASIKAADARQQSQQDFQREENEKRQQLELRKIEINQEFKREERAWKEKQAEIKSAKTPEAQQKATSEAEEIRLRVRKLQIEVQAAEEWLAKQKTQPE